MIFTVDHANVTQTVPCMNGDVVVSVWGTPQR